MKKILTKHCMDERADRLTYILINVGMGEVIKERYWTDSSGKLCIRKLTDTGVIICNPADSPDVICTCFLCDVRQLKSMYKAGEHIPNSIFFRVKKNKRHIEELRKNGWQ